MPFDKDGTLYLDGDENADWIKRVNNGASKREELEAHRELALMYAQREKDAAIPDDIAKQIGGDENDRGIQYESEI